MQVLQRGRWVTWKSFFHDQKSTEWPAGADAVSIRAGGMGWETGDAGVAVK
jgi:hypothetical protein